MDCQSMSPVISVGFERFTNILATCKSPCQRWDEVMEGSGGMRN